MTLYDMLHCAVLRSLLKLSSCFFAEPGPKVAKDRSARRIVCQLGVVSASQRRTDYYLGGTSGRKVVAKNSQYVSVT